MAIWSSDAAQARDVALACRRLRLRRVRPAATKLEAPNRQNRRLLVPIRARRAECVAYLKHPPRYDSRPGSFERRAPSQPVSSPSPSPVLLAAANSFRDRDSPAPVSRIRGDHPCLANHRFHNPFQRVPRSSADPPTSNSLRNRRRRPDSASRRRRTTPTRTLDPDRRTLALARTHRHIVARLRLPIPDAADRSIHSRLATVLRPVPASVSRFGPRRRLRAVRSAIAPVSAPRRVRSRQIVRISRLVRSSCASRVRASSVIVDFPPEFKFAILLRTRLKFSLAAPPVARASPTAYRERRSRPPRTAHRASRSRITHRCDAISSRSRRIALDTTARARPARPPAPARASPASASPRFASRKSARRSHRARARSSVARVRARARSVVALCRDRHSSTRLDARATPRRRREARIARCRRARAFASIRAR